ncbi:MAG: FAD-dependent oxidoreductase, partial [Bacilli bacterium]|nr:FAD-dependent oxidoreductase [Bacilli bacterium]
QTKEMINIPCAACFIALGQVPNNERFAHLVELDHGYIVTDDACKTATTGVFAAGDCRSKKIRQLTTAVADGAIAAVEAVNYIDRK